MPWVMRVVPTALAPELSRTFLDHHRTKGQCGPQVFVSTAFDPVSHVAREWTPIGLFAMIIAALSHALAGGAADPEHVHCASIADADHPSHTIAFMPNCLLCHGAASIALGWEVSLQGTACDPYRS